MIKILIIDDNQVMARAMACASIWKENDVEVAGVAYNGEDAIGLLDDSIDVLVTDVKMPFMDGISLTEYARKHYPEIQVIFISAYSEFEYARQALKLQVYDYISKPVDYSLLLEKVLSAYEVRRKRKESENLLDMYRELSSITCQIRAETPEQEEIIKDALSLYSVLPTLNSDNAQLEISRFESRLRKSNLEAMANHDDQQMDVIYRICDAIETVCVEKGSGLSEIAARVYMSPNYVSTFFKQKTGESITQRMSRIRLEKARRLLIDPNLKIYEICEQVGYTNPYYFSVWFKKMQGVSPTEYRRAHGIQSEGEK